MIKKEITKSLKKLQDFERLKLNAFPPESAF